MSNDCNGTKIPAACADKFEEHSIQLARIETKLDRLCDNSNTASKRLWQMAKGVVLMVVGYILAQFKS